MSSSYDPKVTLKYESIYCIEAIKDTNEISHDTESEGELNIASTNYYLK